MIYKGRVYEVVMVYAYHLELENGQRVLYGDPDLIKDPTKEQLRAAKTRKQR